MDPTPLKVYNQVSRNLAWPHHHLGLCIDITNDLLVVHMPNQVLQMYAHLHAIKISAPL